MKSNATFLHKIGKFLLIVSFVLQLALLAVQYANSLTTLLGTNRLLIDTVGVTAYIGWGSCATQFFLIRLFSMQQRGEGSPHNPYLLLCAASCVYHNWYLIRRLFTGFSFSLSNVAGLVFGLGLTLLILLAIMRNHRLLGLICAGIALGQAAWDVYVLYDLYQLMSPGPVTAMLVCELLYDLGLCFCCAGIRVLPQPEESPAAKADAADDGSF